MRLCIYHDVLDVATEAMVRDRVKIRVRVRDKVRVRVRKGLGDV